MHNKQQKSSFRKAILMLCMLLVVLGAPLTSSLSWLTRQGDLTNQFTLGEGKIVVNENFNPVKKEKSEVSFRNDGDFSVYVRAEYIIYWEDKDGNVLSDMPVQGTDYSLSMGSDFNWKEGTDGFWYYTTVVDIGENTSVLLDSCNQTNNYTDGRILVVDIIAQAIQAEPSSAAEDAWGVRIDAETKALSLLKSLTETAEAE